MTYPAPAALADLQARLQNYVLGDGRADDPLSDLTGGAADKSWRRLRIYHSGYRLRMLEVLQGAFENTWAYLGDDAFEALCSRYIKTNSSHSPNLRSYGDNFPNFLHQALPADPEIAELATMDWRLHSAFDAPNAALLTGEQLATIEEAQWASLGFVFHPSVSLALFEWNALEIWHALDQETPPPIAGKLNEPVGHLFWRRGQRSYFRTLEADEYTALKNLMEGHRFSEVCEHLAKSHPDTGIDASIGTWLARWLADELLSEVEPGPVEHHKPLSACC